VQVDRDDWRRYLDGKEALSILRNAGTVQDDPRRSQVFDSLRLPCVLSLFSTVEAILESTAREEMGKVL